MVVLIQERESGGFDAESRLIYQYCTIERLKTKVFKPEDVMSGSVNVLSYDLMVGSVECVSRGLKQAGLTTPEINYYPAELERHLHRSVWRAKVNDILSMIAQDKSVFAKSVACKQLTGQVFTPIEGSTKLIEFDPKTPLYASDVVSWLSEYRVYVINNGIVSVCFYDGDESRLIDMDVVREGVEVLAGCDDTPNAYAIDWGVLSTGETALIEMNDAWAIGAYKGIGYREYYQLLKTRWDQISQ